MSGAGDKEAKVRKQEDEVRPKILIRLWGGNKSRNNRNKKRQKEKAGKVRKKLILCKMKFQKNPGSEEICFSLMVYVKEDAKKKKKENKKKEIWC